MSKLRDVSLTTGAGTPKPISAYGSASRPAKDAAPTQVPRDGGMADGTTGGNFSSYSRPNGPGPLGTQPTADAVAEQFGRPATSIL